MKVLMSIFIHPTAVVSPEASIADGASVWLHAQIREGATIGRNTIVGKGVYIDYDVAIGENVKIQNYVSVYHGVSIADGVFIGPHVCFTNDLRPRAINPDGTQKGIDDWSLVETRVGRGASIGANSTVRCGVTVGDWAMVGAGSLVTRDIPAYGLVMGHPARLHGFVCPCGATLVERKRTARNVFGFCEQCGSTITVPRSDWESVY
jgi:acetyltransferase-like isoleucine patch superfamily enzyme